MKLQETHKISKASISLMVGFFCLLVCYNNIIDYNTNYQFLEHVLRMDAMQPWFQGEHLKSRAITNDILVHIGYWGIIAGELVAGFFCTFGSLVMLKNIRKDKFEFGQSLYLIGGTVALFVWFLGFATIGAEWFQMWASKWNGQMKAYAFISFIVMTMVYVVMPSPKFSSNQ
ncbi:DUF2165 family protein [Photobacterium leiognathi]|uniref:DUF2165 family protein n=1 Tax=Photobacterium leiognathi TaxID=553611 RepID=UPI002739310E|nr:DUF2165 domain-containing protein [Photobacterium leiognathi]